MKNRLETTGTIKAIYPIEHISNTFKKRTFVLELNDEINGQIYTNYAVFQTLNSVCDLLEDKPYTETIRFVVGDNVKCTWNLRGTRSTKDGKTTFFNNMNVFKIEAAPQHYAPYIPPHTPPPVTPQQQSASFQAMQPPTAPPQQQQFNYQPQPPAGYQPQPPQPPAGYQHATQPYQPPPFQYGQYPPLTNDDLPF